jgi:hypothetical protein
MPFAGIGGAGGKVVDARRISAPGLLNKAIVARMLIAS